jgi:hypothetical protein
VAAVAAGLWCGVAASNAGSLARGPAPVEMPFLKDPGAADRLISLDFNQADIRIFIKTVGNSPASIFWSMTRSGTVT